MSKKCVVLLSGGMDSTVTLYNAKEEYECHVLIFDYGQKAAREVDYARNIAEKAGCSYWVLDISLPWKGSALLDNDTLIPEGMASGDGVIPDTYVPGRNMIFLSYGVSFCEVIGAEALFIGAHQMDFSNYPDCRAEFFEGFQAMADRGTKCGVEGKGVKVIAPLLDMTKQDIIKLGFKLGVPFENTWSCYADGDKPCGKCESCLFRKNAFEEMGIKDPLFR